MNARTVANELDRIARRIDTLRDAVGGSQHHYADVITEDLAEAIDRIGTAKDALGEIAEGTL